MKTQNRHTILIAGITLLLAALACGVPEPQTPPPLPTATPQAGESSSVPPTSQPPVSSPAATAQVPAATDTPPPDVSGPGSCTLNSKYEADVTVPDNTQFQPGTTFVKTWRVRNSGTCNWEVGTKLVFISGDPLGGPSEVAVGAVAKGASTDISVSLTAPSAPGSYKSNWQLQAPDGTRFGSVIYVKIVVPGPATATPTPTNTPKPTNTSTPTTTPQPTPGSCVAPNATLKPVLDLANSAGYDIGCPTALAFSIQGAFQEFWANVDNINPHTHFRSLMIWRSDNREIYVIDGIDTNASQGMLLAYTDFWQEGMDHIHPDCAGMTVPGGYQLPVRGFGKVWCENDLWTPVGWPTVAETTVNLLIQPTQTGLLMKVSGPMSYLIALDYRAVYAITMMTTP